MGGKETTLLWDFNEIRDNKEMMGNSAFSFSSFGRGLSEHFFCQSISLNETLKICSTDSTRDVGTSSCKLFNVFVNWNSSGISCLFFSKIIAKVVNYGESTVKNTFYHTLSKSTVGDGWKETTLLWDFNEIRDNQEMMGNSVYVINSFGLLSNPSWFYFCQSISLNETLKICSTPLNSRK